MRHYNLCPVEKKSRRNRLSAISCTHSYSCFFTDNFAWPYFLTPPRQRFFMVSMVSEKKPTSATGHSMVPTTGTLVEAKCRGSPNIPPTLGEWFGQKTFFWLVFWTPLKNISQLGWLFPIYGKIKKNPNHQPVFLKQPTSQGPAKRVSVIVYMTYRQLKDPFFRETHDSMFRKSSCLSARSGWAHGCFLKSWYPQIIYQKKIQYKPAS